MCLYNARAETVYRMLDFSKIGALFKSDSYIPMLEE